MTQPHRINSNTCPRYWIFLLKTPTYFHGRFWHLVCISVVLLVVAGCGQPIQINNRTPRPSGTRLVDTVQPTRAGDIQATLAPDTEDIATPAATNVADAAVVAEMSPTSALVIDVVITPVIRATPTGDERWSTFVSSRTAYEAPQRLTTLVPTPLLWLDPRNGQVVEIGYLNGDFLATAQLVLTSNNQSAYEVDYTINQDYGLTSISRALITRMNEAGYAASVRAFVPAGDTIVPTP